MSDKEKILSALRDKTLQVHEIMKRDPVKFDIHIGR